MGPIWQNKRYKLDHSTENFEEFLKATGMNIFARKVIKSLSPMIELVSLEHGEFLLKQGTILKEINIVFKPGIEFEDTKPDGTKVKTIITFESDDVLIQKQMDPDYTAEIRREFKARDMEMVRSSCK